MVRPGRDRLAGDVEVDETYVGGLEDGISGRGAQKKALIVVAAEDVGQRLGRIRLRRVPDASAKSLQGFIEIRTRSGVTYDYETKSRYMVIVKADDNNGGTDTVTVTIDLTDDVNEPPGRPAAPTVRATPNTTDSLTVSWSAPSSTGRPAIDNYDLQYREGTTGNWTDGPQNVDGTSVTIAGLTAAPTAYQVQVRATNSDGDGPWSPPGRIRTTPPPVDPPSPPRDLTATAVVVKGYVDAVVVVCGSTVIARHPRSYERDALIFDPLHYVALLERKTGALDQAAPLAGWELPEAFGRLRRLLEARLGKAGTREYVQVLRLLEDFRLGHVRGAVRDALALGVISFDAVKHLVLCRIEHRPPRLDLAQYPHLPAARVATTAAADYLALLGAAE